MSTATDGAMMCVMRVKCNELQRLHGAHFEQSRGGVTHIRRSRRAATTNTLLWCVDADIFIWIFPVFVFCLILSVLTVACQLRYVALQMREQMSILFRHGNSENRTKKNSHFLGSALQCQSIDVQAFSKQFQLKQQQQLQQQQQSSHIYRNTLLSHTTIKQSFSMPHLQIPFALCVLSERGECVCCTCDCFVRERFEEDTPLLCVFISSLHACTFFAHTDCMHTQTHRIHVQRIQYGTRLCHRFPKAKSTKKYYWI